MDDLVFNEVGGWFQFVLAPTHPAIYVNSVGNARVTDEARAWLDEFAPQGYRMQSIPHSVARLQFKDRRAAMAFKVAWR